MIDRILSLQDIKNHLMIDDITEFDNYLLMLRSSVFQIILQKIDRSEESLLNADKKLYDTIKICMLLLISHYFNNKEATTIQNLKQLPLGMEWIIETIRNYSNSENYIL